MSDEAPVEQQALDSSVPEDSTEKRYKRKQYIVDKNLQYYYITAWLSAVVLFILIGFAFFVMFKVRNQDNLDMQRLDMVYRMLLLNSVFLVLFAILMGLHSILHTHRIAGAAYHIRENLRKLNSGQYVPLVLRKKDYLKDIADEINLLRDHIESRNRTRQEVLDRLGKVDERNLPEPVRQAFEDLRQKVSVL